jgi:hypothetical protein
MQHPISEQSEQQIDRLINTTIEARTVWVLGNKVFATSEAALQWKDQYNDQWGGFHTDCEPLKVVLDEAPRKRLFIYETGQSPASGSEHGWQLEDGSLFSPLGFILTNKKQVKGWERSFQDQSPKSMPAFW